MWRTLDAVLLVTMVLTPWALLLFALSRFRDLLRRDWWVLILLAAGLWLFLINLLSPLTETFVQAILHATPKPWFAAYVHSVLAEGRAPLWLSSLGTGLPALANPYVGYFSPFTSLLLFFANLDHGVNVYVLFHLVFIGLSAYLLGRSLGLRRSTALLMILPLLWSPWVFRRLSTEVHALYLFGFAWLPLTWALLLRFLRTRSLADAAATGIPLAFMAVCMPTVFVHAAFAVAFFSAAAAAHEIIRRRWRALGRLALGTLLVVLSSFLAAAPEHLAARELFSVTADTRFIPSRISGGWRDKDLSTTEFLRVLFPHRLGAALFPVPHRVDAFGIPFSPGDAAVTIAAVGAGTALVRRSRRRDVVVPHLLLFVVLASVATHGLAYEPVHRVFPPWGFAGNFPVIGALFLLLITVGFGFGVESIADGIRRLTRTFPRAATRLLLTVAAGFLVAEMLWGIETVARARQGDDPDRRPDLRLTIPKMDLDDLSRLPHMADLSSLTKESEFPARIYCLGDRPVWPSPCFDYTVDQARVEAVGTGELAWAMPWWQWNAFREVEGAWEGSITTLHERILQLAGVQYLVTTRDLPYSLVKRMPWEPNPGNFELYGKFLASSVGGGPWAEAWDRLIRLHAFPGFPRVFFAEALYLGDRTLESTSQVRSLLADPTFDPRAVILIHRLKEGENGERSTALMSRPKSPPKVKLQLRSPRAGAWVVEGNFPRPGALLFSQMYYPGLRAWVNGRRTQVHRADLFLSAVPVEHGQATVTLEYAPPVILLASVITAAFTAVVIGIGVRPDFS